MLVFAAGIQNALSFGVLSNFTFFYEVIFTLLILLQAIPLAFFIAIFAGYVLPRKW